VVRIKDPKTGVVKRALALATDGNGRWCQLNPRVGAMHAVAETARNVAASGARPIAATNCLNFGSPEKPEVMWQFSEAIDGLTLACNEFGTPITGGNVSFYNETLGKSIYPTPVIGILGILEDASRVLKIAFRADGDVILLLDGLELADAMAGGTGHITPSQDGARIFLFRILQNHRWHRLRRTARDRFSRRETLDRLSRGSCLCGFRAIRP
jgi:phosphoribosylformylglycinamidine (FGAM) synthase-like enzyme